MSPFPARLINRWETRSEPRIDEGKLYWHALLGQHSRLRELAQNCQAKLRHFSGLHLTPAEWLHMTILVVGSTDTINSDETATILGRAAKNLAQVRPVTVTFGRILYRPEAIVLGVHPDDDLEPVRSAVQDATRSVIGRDEGVTGGTAQS